MSVLTEKQLDRYADVLIWAMQKARTNKFKKNDVILVSYHMPAVRLAEIVFAKLLDRGLNPVPHNFNGNNGKTFLRNIQ